MTSYLGRKSNPKVTTVIPAESISAHYIRNNTNGVITVVLQYEDNDDQPVSLSLILQPGEVHPQQQAIIKIESSTGTATSVEYGDLV